jgi:hypothetical protein
MTIPRKEEEAKAAKSSMLTHLIAVRSSATIIGSILFLITIGSESKSVFAIDEYGLPEPGDRGVTLAVLRYTEQNDESPCGLGNFGAPDSRYNRQDEDAWQCCSQGYEGALEDSAGNIHCIDCDVWQGCASTGDGVIGDPSDGNDTNDLEDSSSCCSRDGGSGVGTIDPGDEDNAYDPGAEERIHNMIDKCIGEVANKLAKEVITDEELQELLMKPLSSVFRFCTL